MACREMFTHLVTQRRRALPSLLDHKHSTRMSMPARNIFTIDNGLERLCVRRRFATSSTPCSAVRAERQGVHLIVEPVRNARLPSILVMYQASVDSYSRAQPPARRESFSAHHLALSRPRSSLQLASSFAHCGSPPSADPGISRARRGHAANRNCGEALIPRPPTATPAALFAWAPDFSAELRTAGKWTSRPTEQVQISLRDSPHRPRARTDLDDYRLTFATHGVFLRGRRKCFAAACDHLWRTGSDGLLTFREIFDLKLDADLVILSACDTAGKASAAATQSAGLATGGDVALDGLVRAFVGAGSRLVIASHWPVPDDFNATQRLMTGLFSAPAGTPTVTALRQSQKALMDDANTSHLYGRRLTSAMANPVIRARRSRQVK